MKLRIISLCVAFLGALAFSSCSKDTTVEPTATSSWGKLQEKVINTSCVSCHKQGDQYAVESGLVLTSDVAYKSLVGVLSHNDNAADEGLLRIKAGDAENSFFFMKLHDLPTGKDYGNRMPLGNHMLSVGQIEFIRQWINAGAPKDGIVANDSLLDDNTPSPEAEFVPLDPPVAGEGFQLTTGIFKVAPNFEREIFIYKKLPVLGDVFLSRMHFRMRPMSHHLVLAGFDETTTPDIMPKFDVVRDLRSADGTESFQIENQMLHHTFIGGSMVQEGDFNFPSGVGLRMKAGSGIDFNTHYVNYTQDTILGECYANLYTMKPSEVQHEAQSLFLYNFDLTLPPHQQTVVHHIFTNDSTTAWNVFMLTSHNHAMGTVFQIKIVGGARNGELVYESHDWDHPAITMYSTPIVINPGEGLESIVTYNNTTDEMINFGLTSKDEMDIIFGYYY
ncbi:MAG TPA: hypothetical protein VFO76_10700 [Candidatus Kapabacteria bacterium]|nr:hypothetical protein [Candidatus Kapabacteria bacterium]